MAAYNPAYNPVWLRTFWGRVLRLEQVFHECNSHADIKAVLKEHFRGYKVIGEGMYAVVLASPNCASKVIRFSIDPEDFQGWWKFAKVARMSGHMCLPVVYSMVQSKSGIHAAVLKRYYTHPHWKVFKKMETLLVPGAVATPQYPKNMRGLIMATAVLRAYGIDLNDIHRLNVMMDGNIPIIIDPTA